LRLGLADEARALLEPLAAQATRAAIFLAELELREHRPDRVYQLVQLATEHSMAATPSGDLTAAPDTATTPAESRALAGYLSFWAAASDTKVSTEELPTRAKACLYEPGGSQMASLIRFKLAEHYPQQSAFDRAQREFELLAEQPRDADMKEV